MNRALMILAAGLLCLACDKSGETKPEETASKNATTTGASGAAATPAAPTPVVAAPVIADGDLATPADFEESAEKAISKANYKKELAALETDIAKE